MFTKPSLLAGALFLAGAAVSFAQSAGEQEAKLIAVLKSEASQKEKADACRDLARLGTREAVPALAALLADEQLSHMARYGLEPIPDPAVDDALRAALGQLQGRLRVGVIGSIGVRRDTKAVQPLSELLRDGDMDVAQAAARALGAIGNPEAARALQAALPGVSEANQLAFCEGLFRCAEAALAAGRKSDAVAIYDLLRGRPAAPHQVRTGALRGAILARGQDGLPLLLESLRSPDYLVFAAACRTSIEMPGAEVTRAMAIEFKPLPVDNQILLIQTLGKRGDAGALPTLLGAARLTEKPVRIAAIRALPELGDASAAPLLIELLVEADKDIAQASQESLAALPGAQADRAIIAMLSDTDPAQRVNGLDLIARRRMTEAMPELLKAAGDTDAKVRANALKRMGDLASARELPALLDFLMRARSGQETDAAEQAISVVCTRAAEPETMTGPITEALSKATPGPKTALVRVLNAIGGPAALKAVRSAVDDPNAEVRAAAIRALGDWKTADAAPDLLALAKGATNPTDRQLCLRSYLGLARNTELPADRRLSMCRDVAGLIQSKDEKRLLLSALASMPSAQAAAMVAPYLDDADAKEEAASATVAISDKLLKSKDAGKAAAGLVEPLQKAAQATGNADLAARAQDLLKQAQNKAKQP